MYSTDTCCYCISIYSSTLLSAASSTLSAVSSAISLASLVFVFVDYAPSSVMSETRPTPSVPMTYLALQYPALVTPAPSVVGCSGANHVTSSDSSTSSAAINFSSPCITIAVTHSISQSEDSC